MGPRFGPECTREARRLLYPCEGAMSVVYNMPNTPVPRRMPWSRRVQHKGPGMLYTSQLQGVMQVGVYL